MIEEDEDTNNSVLNIKMFDENFFDENFSTKNFWTKKFGAVVERAKKKKSGAGEKEIPWLADYVPPWRERLTRTRTWRWGAPTREW